MPRIARMLNLCSEVRLAGKVRPCRLGLDSGAGGVANAEGVRVVTWGILIGETLVANLPGIQS